MLFTTPAYNFSASELPKVVPDRQFFNIFTSECSFSPQRRTIFRIWTSKSGPGSSVFNIFTSECAFRHQRRTIFPHLNFQKWSRTLSFLTFSLPNVLFATAAYNFSASELPKVVPDPQLFDIFTSECAFRHSGVQFLMSPLSTYLRTRRFNRPTFGLTRHTNLWKNTSISWLL